MAPHVLHMTATPIPRTLSLTAYGDLDTTALHELPGGPQAGETQVVGEDEREGAYEFLRERLREGRQAFVVCPLVEESEKLPGKAAEEEAERLRARRAARLPGRAPARPDALRPRRRRRWRAFAAGETDVLVATTVIEVGIDVAERDRDGDRGGRALRRLPAAPAARAGRARRASLAVPAVRRPRRGRWRGAGCEAVEGERDGFKLAEVDLALRGEGEILGTRQSGLPRFAVAELPEDEPRCWSKPATRCWRCSREHGSLEDPEPRPAARGRPPPLRRRRRRPDPALIDRDGMRVIAGELKGPAAGRAARLEGAADLGPGPRGDLLDARRAGRGRRRPRPLLRHRGAGDRGALARRRPRRRWSTATPAPALGNVERLGLGDRVELVRADVGALAGRRRERRDAGTLRPRLRRRPL